MEKQYLGFFLWVWGLTFSAPCWNVFTGAWQTDNSTAYFTWLLPTGHRKRDWWQCLPAQQSEPVDNECGGTNAKPTHKAGEAFQVHW